ncbi:MAG: YdjY domain-containing protein [Verrucomicrobiia bacterium]
MKFKNKVIVFLLVLLTAFITPLHILSQTVTNNPVKQIAPNLYEIGSVRLDSKNKTLTIPATINMNEGQIEYLLVSIAGKLHESLLKTKAEPYHVQVAMLLLNSKPTPPDLYFKDSQNPIPGEPVSIILKWKTDSGEKTVAAEQLILNIIKKEPLKRGNWVFNGSRIIEGAFIAQRDRSIIAIKPDIDAIFNNTVSCKENENDWIVNTNFPLSVDMPVDVVIELKQSQPKGVKD